MESNRFTVREIVYYAYFALMLTAKGMGLYVGQWPYTAAVCLSFVLIFVKVITTEHSWQELLAIIGLVILGGEIYIHSNEIGALIIISVVIGMKNVSVKRLMMLGTVIWTVTFVLSTILTLTGIRGDIFKSQNKLGLGYIIRYSLGQPHPNVLQISYMLLCVFILYVSHVKGRKLIVMTALMMVGNIYFFIYSISYTGIVLSTLYLMFNYYMSARENVPLNRAEKTACSIIVPGAALFSILGPNFLTGKVWDICNKLLNTRFYIAREYMSINPISLFGTGYCNELPGDLNNLDCSYVFALMHYGVIFFVLFLAGYIGLISYFIKKNKRIELAITLSLCIAAISEPFFVNTSFKNITYIFLGEFLYVVMAKIPGTKCIRTRLTEIGNKQIIIPLDRIDNAVKKAVDKCSKYAVKIVISAVVVGTVAAVLYAVIKDVPAAYYLNRDTVQTENGEHGFNMDINNLPEDFDGVILQYTDADTMMMRLDGNAVKVDYIRGIISMFLWCGLFTSLIVEIGIVYANSDARKLEN